MNVDLYNWQETVSIDEPSLSLLVKKVLEYKGADCDEVALYFVDKEEISRLHADHFDDPTPTDCISFPLGDGHLGEVFVCPEVAADYVQENGGTIEEEIALYVVHGLLHLLGYDDIDDADRAEMRRQEELCLDNINLLT